jgi:hypothetical protein
MCDCVAGIENEGWRIDELTPSEVEMIMERNKCKDWTGRLHDVDGRMRNKVYPRKRKD